jgi:hypothetical protein
MYDLIRGSGERRLPDIGEVRPSRACGRNLLLNRHNRQSVCAGDGKNPTDIERNGSMKTGGACRAIRPATAPGQLQSRS